MSLKAAKYSQAKVTSEPRNTIMARFITPRRLFQPFPHFQRHGIRNAMNFYSIICAIQSKHVMCNLKINELFSVITIMLLVTVVLWVLMKSRCTLQATQEAIRPIQRQSREIMEKLAFLHNQGFFLDMTHPLFRLRTVFSLRTIPRTCRLHKRGF